MILPLSTVSLLWLFDGNGCTRLHQFGVLDEVQHDVALVAEESQLFKKDDDLNIFCIKAADRATVIIPCALAVSQAIVSRFGCQGATMGTTTLFTRVTSSNVHSRECLAATNDGLVPPNVSSQRSH